MSWRTGAKDSMDDKGRLFGRDLGRQVSIRNWGAITLYEYEAPFRFQ